MKSVLILGTLFTAVGIYTVDTTILKGIRFGVMKYLDYRIKKAKFPTLQELADKDAEINDLTMREWIQKTQRLVDAIRGIVEIRGINVGNWTTPDIVLVAKYMAGEDVQFADEERTI